MKRVIVTRGFKASQIDPCLFYEHGVNFIVYVDDCCMLGTSKELINDFLKSLKRLDKKQKSKSQQHDDGFDFGIEDLIEKFLGVETQRSDDKVYMRQLHLIGRIIEAV